MKSQSGISMLEILITIVVMSFGFLSLASFQIGTLKHLSGTNQHYVATSIAASIAESLHANINQVSDYHNQATKDFTACSGTCTIAQQDLARWKAAIEQHGLPDGSAIVVINGSEAEVTVSWLESSSRGTVFTTDNPEIQSYSLQVPL